MGIAIANILHTAVHDSTQPGKISDAGSRFCSFFNFLLDECACLLLPSLPKYCRQ